MILSELLKERNMTKYRLSKLSAVPYSTLNDLCSGKTSLEKCSAETVYRLAKELHVSMEELLAMVDYLSRINGIALCQDHDDIRKRKLSDVLFPSGVLALAASHGSDTAKQQAIANAIPEFLRFNIVESEIRNVKGQCG